MIPELSLSFVLDGVIVILLLVTIVYAARLSMYLKRFKDSRKELEGVVQDLSKHITKADRAIKSLNETVEVSSEELQAKMDRARAMFDELDIVVQSGDALANRLEDLAIRNRKILDGGEGDLENLSQYKQANLKESSAAQEADDGASSSTFAIRDYDQDRGENVEGGGFVLDDEVLSDAERDLYNTLKQSKRKKGN